MQLDLEFAVLPLLLFISFILFVMLRRSYGRITDLKTSKLELKNREKELTVSLAEKSEQFKAINGENIILKERINTLKSKKKPDKNQENLVQIYVDTMTKLKDAQTKIQKRADEEMKIAAEVQRSILPDISALLTSCKSVSGYAEVRPAKMVGGDFYEMEFLDDDTIFFAIGDVSGKGVPAALFMMRALALLKNAEKKNCDIADIVTYVNGKLTKNNSNMMFTTLFAGIFDLKSGRISFSNAAQGTFFIARRETKSVEKLEFGAGLPVGVMEEERYESATLNLKDGDQLIILTDGVTDAINSGDEFYGEERLYSFLESCKILSPNETAAAIFNEVEAYASGTPQFDDTTVFILSFQPENLYLNP